MCGKKGESLWKGTVVTGNNSAAGELNGAVAGFFQCAGLEVLLHARILDFFWRKAIVGVPDIHRDRGRDK
jgi:ketopantoate reductase